MTTHSAVPPSPDRRRHLPAWIHPSLAVLFAAALVLFGRELGRSYDPGASWTVSDAQGGTSPATATVPGSTPTPAPSRETPVVVVIATEPAPPFKAPPPKPTPFPTCPADRGGVTCFYAPPEPTSPPVPTPTPLLSCDTLREHAIAGWCRETGDG